jgi:hypothetical protein
VRRDHRTAARDAAQDALEHRTELVAGGSAAGERVSGEQSLHALPDVLVDDLGLLAANDLVLEPDLSDVDDVGQQLVK